MRDQEQSRAVIRVRFSQIQKFFQAHKVQNKGITEVQSSCTLWVMVGVQVHVTEMQIFPLLIKELHTIVASQKSSS